MGESAKFDNPRVETYRGMPIYKYNLIHIRVNQFELKKIIDLMKDNNLTSREVLAISSLPCEACKGICVSSFNKVGDPVCVPRGIISKTN